MDKSVDNDSWTPDEWWFWRWLNPWGITPPPPHNCCGCIMWTMIVGIALFILWWLLPLLF